MKQTLLFVVLIALLVISLAGCGSARDGYYKGLIDSGIPESDAKYSADMCERTGILDHMTYKEAYDLGVRSADSLGH